ESGRGQPAARSVQKSLPEKRLVRRCWSTAAGAHSHAWFARPPPGLPSSLETNGASSAPAPAAISPLGDGDLDVRTVAEAAANAPARPQSLRRCRGASGGAACGDDSPVGGEHLRG